MKKLLTKIAFVAAGFSGVAYAQQDPQFTQFMFNKLIYNPGYAGTSGAICGVAQFRQQWAGFTGSPQSIAFAGDMRLSTLPIGIGLNVMTDKIGPIKTFFLRGAGSFLIPIKTGTLGIGLDVGMVQKQINSDWITPEAGPDPTIPGLEGNPDFGKVSIDLGFGAFYQIPGKMYVGLSSTHLPAQSIKDGNLGFKLSRHYYFMAGYTHQVNNWLKIEPNVLYKTDISASRFDINLNLKWFDSFWVGGSARTVRGFQPAVLVGGQLKALSGNAMVVKGGLSYDFPTTAVSANGSYEFFIGVCYTPKIKKETSYGDVRYWGF